ncbi:hypothetical protein GGS26DRAFT_258850 [Hypomontagnella submonticulosa]|nr:hypothetical protein GGS26DRAFT_258850 [Hypomontagnella submonticulosa]
MEAAGFSIGLSGLIAVVDSAFSLCQYVNRIREFADDVSEQLFRVENESEKANCWAIEMSRFATVEGTARDKNSRNGGGNQIIEKDTIREIMEKRVEICLSRLEKALKEAENIIKSKELTKTHTEHETSQKSLSAAVLPIVSTLGMGAALPRLRLKLMEQKRLKTLEGMALRKKVKYTFKPWGTDDHKKLNDLIQVLAYWNGELWSLLSRQMQDQLQFQVSCAIMSRTNDASTLSVIGTAVSGVSPALSATANLSRERLSLEQSNTPINVETLLLEWSSVHFPSQLSSVKSRYLLARLKTNPQANSLLIDWVRYEYLKKEERDIAQARIAQICALLSAAKNPEALQLLPSAGYVEDVVRKRYGILLSVPQTLQSQSRDLAGVFSLAEVLNMNKPHAARGLASIKPSLPQRFRLARKLVYSFMQLHSARWLHKGFRGEKVVFFATKDRHAEGDKLPTADFDNPYVVGFEFARQSGVENISLPILRDPGDQIYVHPDLLAEDALATAEAGGETVVLPAQRYNQSYDLYSLALVLIEIGLWQPLSTYVKPNTPAAHLGGEFKKLAARNLAHTMGPGYRDVVVKMLGWEMAQADEETGWVEGLDRAYLEIVKPLEECSCGLS